MATFNKYKQNSIDDEDRPFNMAILFLNRLDRRQEEAQLCKRDGLFLPWLRALENIYDMIEFKIIEFDDEQAKKEIEANFEKCRQQLRNSQTQHTDERLTTVVSKITLSNLNADLSALYRLLNRLIYKYEMLYPKQKDKVTIGDQIDNAFTK
jgi:hypothetical protein